jgi:hypothetical protein
MMPGWSEVLEAADAVAHHLEWPHADVPETIEALRTHRHDDSHHGCTPLQHVCGQQASQPGLPGARPVLPSRGDDSYEVGTLPPFVRTRHDDLRVPPPTPPPRA